MKIKNPTTVALLVALALLTACSASGPSVTVKKFYGYLQAEKAEGALSLISTKFVNTYGRPKLLQLLQTGIQDIKDKGGVRSVKIQSQTIEGDSAVVTSVITYGNGTESSDTSPLVKENGSWKLAPTK
jgi:hypothetical protein